MFYAITIHFFTKAMWYFIQILFLIINYCYSEYNVIRVSQYLILLNSDRDVLKMYSIYYRRYYKTKNQYYTKNTTAHN